MSIFIIRILHSDRFSAIGFNFKAFRHGFLHEKLLADQSSAYRLPVVQVRAFLQYIVTETTPATDARLFRVPFCRPTITTIGKT